MGRWKNNKGWIVEQVHHKVYLENPTAEVQDFEVSHGYNLVTINRGWRRGHNMFLLGGGAVISFPHSTIRGHTYPQKTTQYVLSGATIQGAAARRVDFGKRFFASVEGKLTALGQGPSRRGHATVPNSAFHVLAGAGLTF